MEGSTSIISHRCLGGYAGAVLHRRAPLLHVRVTLHATSCVFPVHTHAYRMASEHLLSLCPRCCRPACTRIRKPPSKPPSTRINCGPSWVSVRSKSGGGGGCGDDHGRHGNAEWYMHVTGLASRCRDGTILGPRRGCRFGSALTT